MSDIRGVILDVDGTLVRGDEPLPGAPAAVQRLRDAGLRTVFCSNNPTKPPSEYVDRLARAGIEATESEVITAATVTQSYLREHHRHAALFVLGEQPLIDYLTEAGFTVVDTPDAADVAVVSIDRSFDYDRLCDAMDAIDDDTPFLGTDPDRVIPAPDRLVPGSGAIINAVAGVVGRDPDRMLGKPSPEARTTALDRLDVAPEDCLVVGDRPDTDIALGADAGMTTALVLTGISDRADLAAVSPQPDFVLESLADIDRILPEIA